MGIDEIRDQQGWNDDTMLMLAAQFIEKRGLIGDFAEYLEEVADEENAECQTDDTPDDYPAFDANQLFN